MSRHGKIAVLLVGNYSLDEQRSMQGFSGALSSGLSKYGVEVKTASPRRRLPRPPQLSANVSKWFGYVDKYAIFPRELRRASRSVDVVHVCDQGNSIYTRHLRAKPHVLTCHDVLAIRSALGEIPYWQTSKTGTIYQKAILNGLRNAQYICCVSTETRNQCIRITGLDPSRTVLLYNGLYDDRKRLDCPGCGALAREHVLFRQISGKFRIEFLGLS